MNQMDSDQQPRMERAARVLTPESGTPAKAPSAS